MKCLPQISLDIERSLTSPWRTSTYKRPFTWEGNYLVTYGYQISSYTWAN